jgi:hypothetical protein
MTKNGEILSKEEAQAISATAKTADRAIEAIQQFGSFLGRVFGTVPEDIVGLFGDYLQHLRIRNFSRLQQRTEEILASRPNIEIVPVSPTLAIPLISAAQDESRPELQEIWARLLANAMDKNHAGVRQSFIEAVKKFDPPDAIVLKAVAERGRFSSEPDMVNNLASAKNIIPDEILISLDHLVHLGCLNAQKPLATFNVTAFGRQLLNACS